MNSPPRTTAPGPKPAVDAPERHIPLLLKLPQLVHPVDRGTQSATHSATFPTMSLAWKREMQPKLAPVFSNDPPGPMLHRSAPGVPAAAACHSAFDGRRLPEFARACCAWNQVILARGGTPATERA